MSKDLFQLRVLQYPALLLVLLLSSTLRGQDIGRSASRSGGEVAVVLDGALVRSGGERGFPLTLHATIRGDRLVEAWGEALAFNKSIHPARILESAVTDEAIHLRVEVTVRGDRWVRGGMGTYEVRVDRAAVDGPVSGAGAGAGAGQWAVLRTLNARQRLTGRFTGEYLPRGDEGRAAPASVAVAGEAEGRVWPSAEVGGEDSQPIEHDERPRLLFRGRDLDVLRDRLDTPLGRAVRARLEAMAEAGDEVALGVLFQVTGEHQYAARALPLTLHHIREARREDEHETHQTTFWGRRLARAAHAYDLCRDGWPAAERAPVEAFLRDIGTGDALYRPHTFGSLPVVAHGTTKADTVYGGGALAAMTLWGTPGPPPAKPAAANSNAAALLQKRFGRTQTAEQLVEHERAVAVWQQNDGADTRYLDALDQARRHMVLSAMHGIGEGGWGGHPFVWEFAAAHRRCFGRDLTPRPIFSRAVAAAEVQTYWTPPEESGGIGGQASAAELVPHRVGTGGGEMDADHLTRMLALAPAGLRGVVLWRMLRQAGLADEALATDEGAAALVAGLDEAGSAVRLLLHLPEGAEPVEPGRAVPRAWRDVTQGWAVFRSGWGDGAILARVQAAEPTRNSTGRMDTGSFLIRGLGHDWAVRGPGYGEKHRTRQMSNALMLGESARVVGSGGVTAYTADPATGSGSLTIDLSDVYREARTVKREAVQRVQEGRVTVQKPVTVEHREDRYPGATGWRSFTADYSGRSGSPAVFVVADGIDLEDDRPSRWVMHLPLAADAAEGPRVEVDGQTFTVHQGDATLRGTVVRPAGARVEHVTSGSVRVWMTRYPSKYSGWAQYPRRRIEVTGDGGRDQEVLVVMTLQRGDPPAVTVGGEGEARAGGAVVRVGDQVLRLTPRGGAVGEGEER